MKRADQHTVPPASPIQDDIDKGVMPREENGIDMPSEKPLRSIDPGNTSMGALPVDSLGSGRSGSTWRSTGSDETHERNAEEELETGEDESSSMEEKTISVGTGPDPENTDN